MTDFSGWKILSREVSQGGPMFCSKILLKNHVFWDLRQRWNYGIKNDMTTSEGGTQHCFELKTKFRVLAIHSHEKCFGGLMMQTFENGLQSASFWKLYCYKHKFVKTDVCNRCSVYTRVPQIFPWRANPLQSLAPTLIKLAYLLFSNNLEDSD